MELVEFNKRLEDDTLHLSYSSITHLLKSPFHYKQYSLRKRPPPTDAMLFGTALHEYILEPHVFYKHFFIVPKDAKRNTKIGKQAYTDAKFIHCLEHFKDFQEFVFVNKCKEDLKDLGLFSVIIFEVDSKVRDKDTNTCKDVLDNQQDWKPPKMKYLSINGLKYDDFETIKKMKEAFMAIPMCRKMVEMAVGLEEYFEIEYKGVMLKMKLDIRTDNIIADLKTCTDADYMKFRRDIWNRKYYLQSAIYSLVDTDAELFIIALDRQLGVSIHFIEQSAIDKGFQLLDKAVAKFLESKMIDNGFDRNIEAYAPENNPYFIFEVNS